MKTNLTDKHRRSLALWAADCAERALPLFEEAAPNDARIRHAILGARAFSRGGDRARELRALCWAAYSAARSVDVASASSAARAAAYAVAIPYLGFIENPYGARQVLGAALYEAYAFELAATNDPAVGDAEIRWAIKRASLPVREAVLHMPFCGNGNSRIDSMLHDLGIGLRH